MSNNKNILQYKDFPEGSSGKKIYDSVLLHVQEYLNKYYSSSDLKTWNVWIEKYIIPAFDNNRHDEMIKNFGYVDEKYYNFDTQYTYYQTLKTDQRLDKEIIKFISFMAGTGYFEQYNITLHKWFNMKDWRNPHHPDPLWKSEYSLDELLNYTHGIDYIKKNLTELPYWIR